MKIYFAIIVFLASISQASAGTSCTFDLINVSSGASVSGNGCYFSGTVNGVSKADISLCPSSTEEANSRNLAVAMTAYTMGWQLQVWFDNYNSCTDIPARWGNGVGRVWLKRP